MSSAPVRRDAGQPQGHKAAALTSSSPSSAGSCAAAGLACSAGSAGLAAAAGFCFCSAGCSGAAAAMVCCCCLVASSAPDWSSPSPVRRRLRCIETSEPERPGACSGEAAIRASQQRVVRWGRAQSRCCINLGICGTTQSCSIHKTWLHAWWPMGAPCHRRCRPPGGHLDPAHPAALTGQSPGRRRLPAAAAHAQHPPPALSPAWLAAAGQAGKCGQVDGRWT